MFIRRARFIVVLSAAAFLTAGCAGSSQVSSSATNAQASTGSASSSTYRTGRGVPSGGYTMDIGTAIRRGAMEVDAPEPAPVIGPPGPGQQTADGVQQPRPKAEPRYNVGYGVSSTGPTTDIFTALFGSN